MNHGPRKALYRYRILRDFEGAVAAYQEAQKRLPNNSFVLQNLALVQRRVGRWQDAEASFTKALALDPLDVSLLNVMGGEFYNYLRRFDQAHASFDRALAIAPDSETAHSGKASVLQDEGRLAEAAQESAHIAEDSTDDPVVASRVCQALYERDFSGVIRVVERKLNVIPPRQALDSDNRDRFGAAWLLPGVDPADMPTHSKVSIAPSRQLNPPLILFLLWLMPGWAKTRSS